jgi:hypothetical protein
MKSARTGMVVNTPLRSSGVYQPRSGMPLGSTVRENQQMLKIGDGQ